MLIQYIIFREGSSISVSNLTKLKSDLVKVMNRHDGVYEGELLEFFQLTLDILPLEFKKDRLYQQTPHRIKEALVTRLPFVKKKIKLINTKHRFK